MRVIDRKQFMWLMVLSILSSVVAIIIDISVEMISEWRMNQKHDFRIWIGSGMALVLFAVCCVQFIG